MGKSSTAFCIAALNVVFNRGKKVRSASWLGVGYGDRGGVNGTHTGLTTRGEASNVLSIEFMHRMRLRREARIWGLAMRVLA